MARGYSFVSTAASSPTSLTDMPEVTAPAAGTVELVEVRGGTTVTATAAEHAGWQRKSATETGTALTLAALNTREPAKAGTYKDTATVTGTFAGSALLWFWSGRPNDQYYTWMAPRPWARPAVVNGEIMGGVQNGTQHLIGHTYLVAEDGPGTLPANRTNGGRRPSQRGLWGHNARSSLKRSASGPVSGIYGHTNICRALPMHPEAGRFKRSWNLLYAVGGPTTFNQAVTAAAIATAVDAAQVGKLVTRAATGTAVDVLQVGKAQTVAAVGTPLQLRRVGKLQTAAATGTALVSSLLGRLQALSVAAVGTPLRALRVGKAQTAAATGTPLQTRQVGKFLTALSTATPLLTRRVGKFLTALSTATALLTNPRFPSTGILDAFNRANVGPPPSSSWTSDIKGNGTDIGFKVQSNEIICSAALTSNRGTQYWSVGAFGADDEVYVTTQTGGTAPNFELWARLTNAGSASITGYLLSITSGPVSMQLERLDSSTSATAIGPSALITGAAAGTVYGLKCVGSKIQAWVKPTGGAWAMLIETTESTYASGTRIGMVTRDATHTYDDFGGGTAMTGSLVSQAVTAASAAALSIVRRVSKAVTSSSIVTPVATKRAGKTVAAASTATPLLAAGLVFLRALTAAAGGAVSMLRRTGKPVAVTGTGTPLQTRRVAKPVVAAAIGTVSRSSEVSKRLLQSATGVPSLLASYVANATSFVLVYFQGPTPQSVTTLESDIAEFLPATPHGQASDAPTAGDFDLPTPGVSG